jgi:aminopeptidase N
VNRIGVALYLLSAASSADAQPLSPAPGHGFDVENYRVSLRPDLLTKAVSGTETIVLKATIDGLATISFTANALRISEATADGNPVGVSSGQDSLAFALPRPLRNGSRITLRFRFEGMPARGITTIDGGLYTSYFACDWMVCSQNTPGDKAHFALDLFLPDGVKALVIGRGKAAIRPVDGLMFHRWRSTRAYSAYLYAFVASRFVPTSRRTAQGDFTYLDTTGGSADLPELFAQTPAMVTFFADKAGVRLPDRRYVQVLVPGSEAQEAASFSLIGKAVLDDERADPASAWVIAHELAHQWWGNLVTCATWQDFWLNEGMATFMVAAWKQERLGEAAYQAELDNARRRLDRVRAVGFDKPLAWNGKYPSLGARRAVQYSKGALFLAHLRQSLGDIAFWNGIRRYTRKHAGGSVTSSDFENAMEAASGRDLSPVFKEWVYGPE